MFPHPPRATTGTHGGRPTHPNLNVGALSRRSLNRFTRHMLHSNTAKRQHSAAETHTSDRYAAVGGVVGVGVLTTACNCNCSPYQKREYEVFSTKEG